MGSTEPHPHIAHTLLSRAHTPTRAATIFTDKVLHKPLVLRPTSPDPTSISARAARRLQRLYKSAHARRRQKPAPLSAKEKRELGVYVIPKEARRFDIYAPLHQLWLGYMAEILGLRAGRSTFVTPQSVGPVLASADFHGALVKVVRCRCVGRVGCEGIVVKDTKFTFEVVTKANQLRGMGVQSVCLASG
jgi:ribonuclease P protein subunit POP4